MPSILNPGFSSNARVNRAGRGLKPAERRTLERAKVVELRRLFGRPG